MAISLVSGQVASANGTSANPSATLPSAPTQNNLLVAFVSFANNGDTSAAANGYTKLTPIVSTDTSCLFYKVAGASEGAAQQPCTITSDDWYCAVVEYTGTDTTSPLDVEAANVDNDATKTISTGANPTIDGTEGLIVGAAANNVQVSTTYSAQKVNGSTTSVNERVDAQTPTGTLAITLFDKVEASIATTNPYTVEAVASETRNGSIHMAIFKAGAISYTLTAGAPSMTYAGVAAAIQAHKTFSAALPSMTYDAVAGAFKAASAIVGALPSMTYNAVTGVLRSDNTILAELPSMTYNAVAGALNAGYSVAAALPSMTYDALAGAFKASSVFAAGLPSMTYNATASTWTAASTFLAGLASMTYNALEAGLLGSRTILAALPSMTYDAIAGKLRSVPLLTGYAVKVVSRAIRLGPRAGSDQTNSTASGASYTKQHQTRKSRAVE